VRRHAAAAAGAVVLLLTLTACEDASQRDARHVVQAYLERLPSNGYRTDDVHCTRAARLVLNPVTTKRFLCTAPQRGTGDCDWFRVDARADGGARVVLVRRNAGCVLPSG
jgi:hypothetical protein